MAGNDDVTLLSTFRNAPVRSGLVTLVPVGLAAFQVLNSYVHDLSFVVSLPFAAVMVTFAALLTQHHLAEFRLRRLEQGPTRAAD